MKIMNVQEGLRLVEFQELSKSVKHIARVLYARITFAGRAL